MDMLPARGYDPHRMNEHHSDSRPAQVQRLVSAVEEADRAVAAGQPADAFLARLFRINRNYGSKTRRLISNTVFSYFRWRGWVLDGDAPDYAFSLALAHALDADELDPLIAYWSDQPGRSDCVMAPAGGLALEEKAERLAAMARLDAPPSYEDLIPKWAVNLLAVPPPTEPDVFRRRVVASFQERPVVWLRFARTKRELGLRALADLGYDVAPHPILSCAGLTRRAISREHAKHNQTAAFEIQDLASQCVGLIADPRAGERWWDVCAGAGGKTLHLADLMDGQGEICATEIRRHMLREVERRARRANVSEMITAISQDGRRHEAGHVYDGVLLDAPCSGMGTWSRSPDARWRMSREQVADLTSLQRELLATAADHVRPGGVLIYAVCTLTASETLEQVQTLERIHPDFTPDAFEHPLTRETVPGQAWIYPWDGPCGGMFVARWRRKEVKQ